jgi:hypothetical protein
MKVKLIQSGGFIGRTKTAELELLDFKSINMDQLEKTLINLQAIPVGEVENKVRDGFVYSLEYNGIKVNLNERTNLPTDLSELVSHLKESLKY